MVGRHGRGISSGLITNIALFLLLLQIRIPKRFGNRFNYKDLIACALFFDIYALIAPGSF
jgi:hypothetical protein